MQDGDVIVCVYPDHAKTEKWPLWLSSIGLASMVLTILSILGQWTLSAQFMPPTPVTITPASVTVAPKATVQFKTSAKSPRWSWTGAGSLSQTGLYTAPAAVPISPFDVVQISVTDAGTNQSTFATLMIIQAQAAPSQFTDAEVLALKQMVNLVLSGHWCFGTAGCSIPK